MNIIKFKKNIKNFIKWINVFILITTIIASSIFYQKMNLFIRLILSFFILTLISFIIISTKKGKNLLSFIYNTRIETYKVIWPTYKDMLHTTYIITIITIIVSYLLYILDSFLIYIISYLTGTRL